MVRNIKLWLKAIGIVTLLVIAIFFIIIILYGVLWVGVASLVLFLIYIVKKALEKGETNESDSIT